MAMSKLYEVNVTVKVVIHAFDANDAAYKAADRMQMQGWSVGSTDNAKVVK